MTKKDYTATIRVSPYSMAMIDAACRHSQSTLQQALAHVLASRKAEEEGYLKLTLPFEVLEEEQ
ncbi:MAG: hypothetical protein IKK45_07990 [Akkermansia sp.]|nr:hypothetical protein [Akkermansia sp.]